MGDSKLELSTIQSIKKTLIERKIWLSVAESVTCGNLQAKFGGVAGVSDCFKGGITAYSIFEKVKFLKVDGREAQKVDCVSPEIAGQMAKGVSGMFETEIGIATTGYAQKDEKNEAHAYFAIYLKEKDSIIIEDVLYAEGKERTEFQVHIAEIVFERLLDYLNDNPS